MPRRRLLTFARALVVLVVAALLSGCDDDHVVELARWTLSAEGSNEPGALVELPAHVGALVKRRDAAYTLSCTVPLPPELRGKELTLALVRLGARVSLRAAGEPMASLDDEPDGYRGAWPHRWRIPATLSAARELPLELTVEHRWTQSEWLDTVPRLSATPHGDTRFVLIRAFNLFTAENALGMAAFSGYLYLVIFLSDRRRVVYAWFALTGFSSLTYPLFELGGLQRLLGPFELASVGVGVSAAVVCNLHFTHAHFELPSPSRVWTYLVALVVVTAAASVGYFRATAILPLVTTVVAAAAIGYDILLLVRLARARPRPVNLFTILVPWTLLGVLALPDFVAWNGLGELLGGLRTAWLGIAVIALLQTAALSREHTFSLRHADELAEERRTRIAQLESRNREVDQLNDELRRQVAARSSHLAEALARIGSASIDTAPLGVGDVVDGRYRVVSQVGAGGGGTVYAVERVIDGRELALKVIRGVTSSQMLARFAREAQLVAQVHHDNVVSIVDVEVASSGFLYLVMELVVGSTLRERKAEFGRREWALGVMQQVAAGLAAIHAHGIVHRDLKPANVLVSPSAEGCTPMVKIADFGIASAVDRHDQTVHDPPRVAPLDGSPPPPQASAPSEEGSLTETGVILGTPFYMAPELVQGAKNAQPSADVFSLGMIAFEVLSGAPPFVDPPAVRRMRGRSDRAPVSLAVACAGLAPGLVALVDRALSFDPEARPGARELADALDGALRLERLRG